MPVPPAGYQTPDDDNPNTDPPPTPRDLLETVIDNQGIYDVAVRPYSGRGMYGKRCVAVSFDSTSEALAFMMSLGVELGDDGATMFRNPSTDSMGLGIVVYWPRLAWTE